MKKRTDYHIDRNLVDLLADGANQGVFPGGAAAVSWGSGAERTRRSAFTGIKDIRFPGEPVSESTIFDLASLSKALSTTLILYSLIEEKN